MMPFIDHGEKNDTPGVPYQPVPLETGDMKPPKPVLMPGARQPTRDWLAAHGLSPGPQTVISVDGTTTPVLTPFQSVEDIPVTTAIPPDDRLAEALLFARADEREACARLIETLIATFIHASKGPVPGYLLDQLPRSIRARG